MKVKSELIKLINQNLSAQYLVLYNSSAKDANATDVKREDHILEFIVENTTYVYYTENLLEAYYLTSILNSTAPNEMMKDFQARQVHKKNLDIYYPKFDEKNEIHKKLATLSQNANEKVSLFIKDKPPHQELTSIRLGRLRLSIKNHLSSKMEEIDRLVKKAD